MLTQIYIKDLATIEEIYLPLSSGCTMITGETGAGKSIFIESIELALGARASANLIRPGKEKAEISLSFDISHFPKVIEYLKQLDLYDQDHPECLIRRLITSDGKSKCFVNGSPSPLQLVKDLGELLFHLHSQHEQQVLLKSDTQREMLDRYGDLIPLAQQVKQYAEAYRELEKQIQTLQQQALDRATRSDYLKFQLEELLALKLQAGEWENLEAEHRRLSHAEELIRHLQNVIARLSENEEQPILAQLNDSRKILESIQNMEPKAQQWLSTLNSALLSLQDLSDELQQYLQQTDIDPEKLQQIDERISQVFNLSRKHKMQPEQLVEFTDGLQQELTLLDSSEIELEKLQQRQQTIKADYQRCAEKLTIQRQQAAKKLEKEMTTTIRSLSLPHGEFKIHFEKLTDDELALYGQEKIIFLVKTNPDQSLQPLAKVVSGGELSRLSLAAHLALASRTTIPTLIFDEVDTGLSGATAEKIGKLLRKLGDSYQVFCVSHQPQVAACGHHQLLVEKCFIQQTTQTRLRLLNADERQHEIARMLGGEKITATTLEHAREVLEGA